jgi:hypothetical protein
LANALVTLDRTMWGIAMKHVKTGMLLAATVALTLAWTFLPHPFFGIVVACAAIGALSVVLGINALRQLSGADPPPRQPKAVPHARGRRFTRAKARTQRRGEVLHPEATVTLSEERAAAGVDDVFASLDRELVGLLPVKKKVEEIASLLLVDRVRQKFGLSAPRPTLHMCFTGEPG